jgi:predicted DCC family thiol-disulfide oxidoreductase YuxK
MRAFFDANFLNKTSRLGSLWQIVKAIPRSPKGISVLPWITDFSLQESFPVPENLPLEMATPAQAAGHALILYDGVCGLCNRVVQFVLRHDAAGRFWFCALQDPMAGRILESHELDSPNLDTFCLVTMPFSSSEQVQVRSNAAVGVLLELGGWWRFLGKMLRIVPRPLRDLGYRVVARTRYRVFGRLNACPLPSAAQRDRFLESS